MDSAVKVVEIDRYASVRSALPEILPPLTRIEAERAAGKLWRKFAPKRYRARGYTSRRAWSSKDQTTRYNERTGWGALIHDISHEIFWRTYPDRRPHDPLHAKYESDIARHVAGSGWLSGTLKPAPKARPTTDQKRAAALVQAEAAISRWESKARRAANALKKLRAKRARIVRVLSASTNLGETK